MPTARERMLALSDLASGNTARAHFLSITQSGGGTVIVQAAESIFVEMKAVDVAVDFSPVVVEADITVLDETVDLKPVEAESELSYVRVDIDN